MQGDIKSQFFTRDTLLSRSPCALVYATLLVGAANNKVTFYNGNDANGEIVNIIHSAVRTTKAFKPAEPIPCPKGLFAALSSNVDGVFVQWRELGHKEG